MKDNLISVILTVYNREKCLKKCIDSILSQKKVNFELIIIDDGSSDSSPQICDRYAAIHENIRVIHEKNKGISAARNKGLDNAKGDYVFIMDDDDFLPEDALFTLLSLAIKHDADLVMGNYAEYSADGSFRKKMTIPKKYCNKTLSNREACEFLQLIYHTFIIIVNWAKLYRKEVWDGIRFPEEIRRSEDQFVFPALIDRCRKIYMTDKVVYNQVFTTKSISRSKFDRRQLYHSEGMAYIIDYLISKGYYDLAIFKFEAGIIHLMKCKNRLHDELCTNEISRQYEIYSRIGRRLLSHMGIMKRLKYGLFIKNIEAYFLLLKIHYRFKRLRCQVEMP